MTKNLYNTSFFIKLNLITNFYKQIFSINKSLKIKVVY